MKNEIYDNMLSAYDLSTEQKKRNAIFEVNQQVILAGLYNGGFFSVATFYGVLAFGFSMAFSVSVRTWIFLF